MITFPQLVDHYIQMKKLLTILVIFNTPNNNIPNNKNMFLIPLLL